MAKRIGETKVVTNEIRLSFAHVWEPESVQGSDPKYSASILIPKEDKETLKYIKEAIDEAIAQGLAKKWNNKMPKMKHEVLKDGDEERPEDEAYENCYYVNANSYQKPGIVDINRAPITDEDEVYSGCYARVSLFFTPYDNAGNKGVSCRLNNIQKTRDGEVLAGIAHPEDDFDDEYSNDDDDDFLN